MVTTPKTTILTTTLALFCLGMIYASQQQADLDILLSYNRFGGQTTISTFSGERLRRLDLGFHRLTADWLWLTTIQYFGTPNQQQQYPALGNALKAVTTIDPNFEYPYLLGGQILPWQGEPEVALELLTAGAARFPENGLFPYNAGAVARIHLKDPKAAAIYFQQAVGLENTPPAASLLAGANLSTLSDREFALAWWDSVIESTDNEIIRERARVWREHLQIVMELENTIAEATVAGYTINTLADLVTYGFIDQIPSTPLHSTLYLNQNTGLVEIESR